MSTLEEKIDVMQAFATGKYNLECMRCEASNKVWRSVETPGWNWATYEYRVVEKPIERVQVTLYPAMFVSAEGDLSVSGVHFRDEARAKRCVEVWNGRFMRLLTERPITVFEDELK